MKLKTILAAVLLSSLGRCFAAEIVGGGFGGIVFPLNAASGKVLQWNALPKGGDLSENGSGEQCVDPKNCFGYDGSTWQFTMTNAPYCTNTCTYSAVGNLYQKRITLPDGSTGVRVIAEMVGTFVDGKGKSHSNILGFFDSYTTEQQQGGYTPLAGGGVTIVLAPN